MRRGFQKAAEASAGGPRPRLRHGLVDAFSARRGREEGRRRGHEPDDGPTRATRAGGRGQDRGLRALQRHRGRLRGDSKDAAGLRRDRLRNSRDAPHVGKHARVRRRSLEVPPDLRRRCRLRRARARDDVRPAVCRRGRPKIASARQRVPPRGARERRARAGLDADERAWGALTRWGGGPRGRRPDRLVFETAVRKGAAAEEDPAFDLARRGGRAPRGPRVRVRVVERPSNRQHDLGAQTDFSGPRRRRGLRPL
mmetsp:Transcript_17501/g.53821  ORF Transcript_17501/g.53821 Transcript_17501/m.53821 type:complete len:254 (+) Transcript_17501:661-1422(+)